MSDQAPPRQAEVAADGEVKLDMSRVVRRLAERIAQHEIHNAEYDTLVQQLAADCATKDAEIARLKAELAALQPTEPAKS